MKRFISAAGALCLGVYAAAAPSSQLEEVALSPSKFLMSRVAKGEEVTFCVQAAEKEWPLFSAGDFALQASAALYEWPRGTAQFIREAGRSKEFADLLPLLDKARVRQLPACNLSAHAPADRFFQNASSGPVADISVIASPRYCGTLSNHVNAFFVEDYQQAAPFVCFGKRYPGLLEPVDYPVTSMCREEGDREILDNARDILQAAASGSASAETRRDLWRLNRCYSYEGGALFAVLVHEFGHAFGAADEYSAVNNDPLFSSIEPQDGVMRGLYDSFGCSEADTAVLLLDRALRKSRTFTSFCQNGVTFKNGVQTVLQTTPAKAVLKPGRTVLFSLTPDSPSSQTLLAEIWESDFSPQTQAVIESLGWNADGAEIYCGGPQKSGGVRTGVWECILSDGDSFSAAQVRYNASGRLLRTVIKSVPDSYAQDRFARMKNLPEQKIVRMRNLLKRSL